MDRPTVFVGALPRAEDFLALGQDAMIGLGFLAQSTLGNGPVVDGFTLVPTAPASLAAVLSPGAVYEQENLEATAWSALPANAAIIVKQGIALNPQNLTFTPPTAVGYSQCFLVEASYLDSDTGSLVLPYYNAANPQVPFSGPANAGTANNTIRQGAVAVQIKAGIAAPSGTQTIPSTDAGWAGMYIVTLAQGATTVTAGNIALYAGAPFVLAKLPAIPGAVQAGGWTFAGTTTNSANAFSANLAPAPAAFPVGMVIRAKMNAAPTGPATLTLNGQTFALQRRGGLALAGGEWNAGDVVTFDVLSSSALQVGGVASGLGLRLIIDNSTSAATITANTATSVGTRVTDAPYLVFPAHACAGATTLDVGFGPQPLTRNDTAALQANDYIAGQPLVIVDDGTEFRIVTSVPSQIAAATSSYVSNYVSNNYAKGSLIGRRIYATPGTFTYNPTAGTNKIRVAVQAAGGGGGGTPPTASGQFAAGGGGAAGGAAISTLTSGFAGATITVGTAGAGGTYNAANEPNSADGLSGTSSSFGSFLSATGGQGARAGQAGTGTNIQAGGGGGMGSGGNEINMGGLSGTNSTSFGPTNFGSGFGGASPLYGGGGNAVYSTTRAGANATSFGAGGSGAGAGPSAAAQTGGNGSNGYVVIEEYA